MANAIVKSISYTVSYADASAWGSDICECQLEAPAEAYAAAVRDELTRLWPDAEIEVEATPQHVTDAIVVEVSDDADDYIESYRLQEETEQSVGYIASAIWDDGQDWWPELEPCECNNEEGARLAARVLEGREWVGTYEDAGYDSALAAASVLVPNSDSASEVARWIVAAVLHGEREGYEDYRARATDVASGREESTWAWPYTGADEAYVNAMGYDHIAEAVGVPCDWELIHGDWLEGFERGYRAAHDEDDDGDC